MAVIEQRDAAVVEEIGLGERNDSVRRRVDRRAFGGCDVDAEMRRLRLAVQMRWLPNRPLMMPGNGQSNGSAKNVSAVSRVRACTIVSSSRLIRAEFVGRRCHEFFRQAVDGLQFILAGDGRDHAGLARAVSIQECDGRGFRLIEAKAENEFAFG